MPTTRIHPMFKHVLKMSKEDRIDFLKEPRWLSYPSATNVLNELHLLMEMPKRPRMRNLLLVGDPNNGKTTIIRYFLKKHGEGYIDEEEMDPIKPVVVTEAPPAADERGLYVAILSRFFTPFRERDPIIKLRMQAIHMLRYCKTRILIIDEFHSLLTGTSLKQREVMNAIKHLCNEVNIPIVGVGTRQAVQALHSDPQHASRFDVMTLPLWSLDLDFHRLLVSFEMVLPLKKPSTLHQPKLAAMIHAKTRGNIGYVSRILSEAATTAIQSGTEQITVSSLKDIKWQLSTHGILETVA